MLYTTFKLARGAGACQESYKKFGRHVGGIRRYGLDTLIALSDVVKVCGLADALWTLRCCTESESARRLSQTLACDYADHVIHIYEQRFPDDSRVRDCIVTARRFVAGLASQEELATARDAAGAAARHAAWAAARDAAWAAAGTAARAAAGATAWAARAAARTARDAARTAETEWQTERFIEVLNTKGGFNGRIVSR